MPVVNGYTDLYTLKLWLGITGSSADTLLTASLNAASRAVDGYCQRRFWLDPTPVARTFRPDTLLDIDLIRQDPSGGDIGSTTGLVVATDPSGDGTYEVVWASTDYQLLPANAARAYPQPKPWTALRAVGTKTFPWLINTWLTRLDRVQITARWGWPEVPDAVTEATLIKAARLYHRKDSPQGVLGFGEFGAVRVTQRDDPDVCLLLDDYRVHGALVA
jgi:hypothetical protein